MGNKINKIRAVIFDMDGVIIDSEPIHYRVNKGLFKELGLHISEEEYSDFIGCSNKDMWEILKEKYGLRQRVEELINHQIEEYIKDLKNSSYQPISGVKELLDILVEKNLKIGIASSSPRRYIEKVIKVFALGEYFQIKISGEELEKSKPDPEIYLDAAWKLGEKPENCLAIEDSEHGVTAAKKAGMKCIGYKNPGSGNQDLSKADIIVDAMGDISSQLIENLGNS